MPILLPVKLAERICVVTNWLCAGAAAGARAITSASIGPTKLRKGWMCMPDLRKEQEPPPVSARLGRRSIAERDPPVAEASALQVIVDRLAISSAETQLRAASEADSTVAMRAAADFPHPVEANDQRAGGHARTRPWAGAPAGK